MPVAEPLVRADLAQQVSQARAQSDELFKTLRPEFLYDRPIAQRHRVIFYVGHLEAFDFIQICGEGLGMSSPEPEWDELFRAGIDPDGESLPTDAPSDWPSLERIQEYVRRTRAAVDEALQRAPASCVHMAIEHRLMHLETLVYMWHNFDFHMKQAPAGYCLRPQGATVANSWLKVKAGPAVLGKERDEEFGWDNEYDRHMVDVPAFTIQQHKVTNGEYLEYVNATGDALPHFWTERNGRMLYRGMFAECALPLDWPVYATKDQADAYATWLKAKLPSEAQFHRAAYGEEHRVSMRRYPWGNESPKAEFGNFDFKSWEPESVNATPAGRSAFGVDQLVGNGWEWTDTPFAPFAGFAPAPTYPGYSANFFDGEHFVMKGGSPQTAARLLRSSFRNWFRHDYPYVYGTFRCVR